jgi:hypothetical protein
MGLFDIKNITRRADRLMNYHIEMLNQLGYNFERDGEGFLSYDSGSEDYLRVGYNKNKKMLSRTFNLEIKQVIKNIEFEDSFKIKLRFQGFKEINGALFVSEKAKGKASGYEDLFNNKAMLEKIWKLAKEVEMAYVKIEYIKRNNQLEIRICPYAGAFLWVVVPPIFYDMKLRQPELVSLMKMIGVMKEYVLNMAGGEEETLGGPAA